jgi:hypothetical protein
VRVGNHAQQGGYADPNQRVLLGRVAVQQRDLVQVKHVGGRWPYWTKASLLVRANSPNVTVSVPTTWRTRAAIEWGDSGVVSSLRFAPWAMHTWNAYVGGFYLRRSACVPLIVRVQSRTSEVRFGLGKRCR